MDFSKTELLREAQWRAYANDPVLFFKECWYIQHPEEGAILFELFEAQESALDIFQAERLIITLKARQIGWTTLVAAYAFWAAFFHPDRLIIFLSKGEREAKVIMQKVVYGWKRIPDWMRQRVNRTNDNQSEFIMSNGSSIESLPSKSDPARGRSAWMVVVDEWAFLENPEDAWASIEPVADVGGRVLGLSTANGWGNFFHSLWVGARTGTNDFTAIFEPWDARDDRDADWYQAKLASLPEWQLHQEYPRTEEEAFIQGGNPFFDVALLSEMPTEEPEQGFLQSRDRVTFIPQGGANLSIWDRPMAEETYVIGADVAEGLEHGDYCSAHVIRWRTHEVVAHWHGHIAPDEFAEILGDLGRYYNTALVGVEANNHGLTTCKYLKDMHRYPNIFYARILDERNGRVTNKIGWHTTKKTRPVLLDDLAAELRDGSLRLLCRHTIGELRTFVRDVNGKVHGSPFDDRVISLGIAVQMLDHAVQWNKARNQEIPFTLDWWRAQTRQAPTRMVIGAHNVR